MPITVPPPFLPTPKYPITLRFTSKLDKLDSLKAELPKNLNPPLLLSHHAL